MIAARKFCRHGKNKIPNIYTTRKFTLLLENLPMTRDRSDTERSCRSLSIWNQTKYKKEKQQTLNNLAQLYAAQNNFEKAYNIEKTISKPISKEAWKYIVGIG